MLAWHNRLRAIEAACWLVLAWPLVRIVPFRWVAPLLGSSRRANGEPLLAATPAGQRNARDIRAALNAAERRLPWHSSCLMRSIAGKIMLTRRGTPNVLMLGVTRDPARDRAHAWLVAEGIDVSGGVEARAYTPIAEFASPKSESGA